MLFKDDHANPKITIKIIKKKYSNPFNMSENYPAQSSLNPQLIKLLLHKKLNLRNKFI